MYISPPLNETKQESYFCSKQLFTPTTQLPKPTRQHTNKPHEMLAAVVLLSTVASSPPPVPPQFQSSVQTMTSGVTYDKGTFIYDSTGQETYWSGTYSVAPLVPEKYVNTSAATSTMESYLVGNSSFLILQGQTRPVGAYDHSVWNIFGWVASATYYQDTVIDGREVAGYRLFSEETGSDLRYYCTNDDAHLPVRLWMNVSAAPLPGTPAKFSVTSYTLGADITTTIDPSILAQLNQTLAFHPPTCPAPQPVTNEIVDMYIFHPKEYYNISGQDTADAVGDTAFVCLDSLRGNTQADNYSVVSWYQVEVYPLYGQYQFCNGYAPSVCLGAEPLLVGREASFGISLTDNAGQCSENPLTGTWYNLPATGECMGDATPDGVTCAWKVHKLVKTVEGSCILNTQSMLNVCKAEQRMPFPKSVEIFTKAFTEDDVAKGGCPALPRP